MERHLEEWVFQIQAGGNGMVEEYLSWADRIQYGLDAIKDIVGKVWIYVVVGIAVGAGIHGFVPEGFMASIMGKGASDRPLAQSYPSLVR